MYYVNPYIKDLYRVKFHDVRDDVLRLDMNENPVGLPGEFVEEVKKKLTPSFLATYPLKDELVSLLAQHNGVKDENITVTAGSDEAMRLIFQCFGEAGREVLTVSPTFEMYDVYSKMFGMVHVMAEYNDQFQVSVAEIVSKINENTGIVILLNPNSPIGTAYSGEEFEQIIERAAQMGALVVIDEAYHYFYEPSMMEAAVNRDHVLVLRTCSKLLSIAGLRVGYAVGDPQLITYLENAESTFNVNNVGILFATEILKRPDMLEELRLKEKEGHDWLAGQISAKGYRVYSANGNYLLFYPKRPSGELVVELKEQGIWIRDYGRGILKGWLRVSTGDIDSMRRFWEAYQKLDQSAG